MKKVLALVAVAAIMATAGTALAAKSIVGTKHDLSSTGGSSFAAGSGTQICIYCHTPHNAVKSIPLWNRYNSPATYVLYSGVGMTSISNKSGLESDSTSLFCMSCHDGSLMAGAMVANKPKSGEPMAAGRMGTTNKANLVAGSGAATTYDLSTTHPINFAVGATDTALDLWVGTGSKMGNAASISGKTDFPLFKTTGRGAGNRSLECGSCHAVHDNTYAQVGS